MRCPLCGTPGAACGGHLGAQSVGFVLSKGSRAVGELKPYQVKVGDVETTLLLTEEDAQARGLVKVSAKAVDAPPNKARGARGAK